MTTPDRLGKYEITEVLGRGAMGVVYKGFDPGIRRTVAIKTIRRELIEGDRPAAALLARFRNEARAAGQLAHPGIVAVYDYGEDASVAYIAMEYVEGNSLREYFERGTRFAEADVVSIMSQLLDALGHAHARHVWHRDIKPANLIVMMDGRVKVADFGIARIESSDLTHTGAVMGSPGYMAPEQYAAAAIDHRADIFAAGVVFYQLLTGKRPFVGSPEQVAYAICHTEVPRVSLVDVSRNVEQYDAIVAKAIAKRPEDRFKTADAFRAAILEAHAAPASATISAETIITEVLRPAAALDSSSPPGPHAVALLPAAPPARSGPRWSVIASAGLALALVAAGATWYVSARKAAPPAPAPEPVAAAPAASAAPPAPPAPARAQPDELVFWESMRNSTNRAELEAYLARYPDGAFAALARARLEALAAAEAKPAAAPAPKTTIAPPTPERKAAEKQASVELRPAAKPDASQEALFWESVRATSNPAELKAYLEKYPGGTFAPLARARIDALAAGAAQAAAEPRLNLPPRAGTAPETLRLPAAAGNAAKSAAASAPAARYAGSWKGSMACDALEDTGPFTTQVAVTVSDDTFVLERGVREQPGYFSLRGTPDAEGRLQLLGTGVSGMTKYRGQSYKAGFDGKFEGDRYQAPGKLGTRLCVLTIARVGS